MSYDELWDEINNCENDKDELRAEIQDLNDEIETLRLNQKESNNNSFLFIVIIIVVAIALIATIKDIYSKGN